METKREIRRESLERRRELPADIRRKYSHRITKRVLCHPFFQCADTVFCYVSFREEVDTKEIIQKSLKMGKTVAVPKVHGENRMGFYQIFGMDDLKPGYQGILEPDGNDLDLIQLTELLPEFADADMKKMIEPKDDTDEKKRALMLLPGAAFDRSGNRIGYGGGFYDAYLQKSPCLHKIGLAFSCQCVDKIPAEAHDVRVDTVITEVSDKRKDMDEKNLGR